MSRKHHADIIHYSDVGDGTISPREDLLNNTYKILAEGDSWFTLGGIPNSNLLKNCRFEGLTAIVSCAKPGDTIRKMSKIRSNKDYKEALDEYKNLWSGILLSAGGNDMIDAIKNIILPKKKWENISNRVIADYCNFPELTKLLKQIDSGYRKLASLRDSASSNIPIFTHTYDYLTPRDSPARFFGSKLFGPWLYSGLTEREVPVTDWVRLADFFCEELSNTIINLSRGSNRINNFYVINSLNTLERATIEKKGKTYHWLNEIHPNKKGYRKIADKISSEMAKHLIAT